MKEMSCAEFAVFLFSCREKPIQLEFYGEYNPTTDEKSWAFRAVTANFVDSNIVLINYYGGGALFAYEFTDTDTDASGLRSCLETYFYATDLGHSVWVELPEKPSVQNFSDKEGYWIEDTPFSCCCSVCGSTRWGGVNDLGDDHCPLCHARMKPNMEEV